jgi:short-subunit dehydrogenase
MAFFFIGHSFRMLGGVVRVVAPGCIAIGVFAAGKFSPPGRRGIAWHAFRSDGCSYAKRSDMKIRLKNLSEQVIVIVGATSGIGLATARRAARRGARLVLAARNEDALSKLCAELDRQGVETCHVVADVGDEEDVRNIAAVALRRFGGFDTWMNIAGTTIFGTNEQVATEDMRRLFDTNFWGVVYGSLAAVRHLRARGGALINVGSELSDRAVPLQGIYSASKHAVKGFTDSLRMELEHDHAPVSVTLVKPAAVATMFVEHAKNYMDVEPKLPPPVYAPEIVADALLYAAAHPKRDIHVGSHARLVGAAAHYMPGLLDAGMERFMYRMQRTDRRTRRRDDGNLYAPQQDLAERADIGSGRVRETSLYTSAVTHPGATMMLGAGLALAALWQSRRKTA